jgi:hypothetical protein
MHGLAIVAELPRPADPGFIREIVAGLRRGHADASGLIDALTERLEHDHDALASASAFIVLALLTGSETAEARRATNQPTEVRRSSQPTIEQRRHRREQARQEAKAIASRYMLDLLMPNGKRMKDCSGAEMRGFGVAYSRIGARVGWNRLVGDVLREAEVRTLLRAPA